MQWLKNWLAAERLTKVHVMRDKSCPICQSHLVSWTESKWYCDENGQRTSHGISLDAICPQCQKLTVDDPWVPDNDNELREVIPNAEGWVTCPCCGWRFPASDAEYFVDGRHRKCGQRLILKTPESENVDAVGSPN